MCYPRIGKKQHHAVHELTARAVTIYIIPLALITRLQLDLIKQALDL